MPRPSASRPPPLTNLQWAADDVGNRENEPPMAYHPHPQLHRQAPATVRKALFNTPSQKPLQNPFSPSPTHPHNRPSITHAYYEQHHLTPVKTPLPRRPSGLPSTARRPAITRLRATPLLNRGYRGIVPDRWRARQVEDLTAWLNHELSPLSDTAALPIHQLSSSVVFLTQINAVTAIYRSEPVQQALKSITNAIKTRKLNVSKEIRLATFVPKRNELISLLLLNYHPHWLLLALSVVLGVNIAEDLDTAVEKACAGNYGFDHDQTLMVILEKALHDVFLANSRTDNVDSRRSSSPGGVGRDRFNALILHRTLAVVYLLDHAKRKGPSVIDSNPSLFRIRSNMVSSEDVLRELRKILMNDDEDLVRNLRIHNYAVSYRSPFLQEFREMKINNLMEDIQDGSRLCMLACIMRRNNSLMRQVTKLTPGFLPHEVLFIKKKNIEVALRAMKECVVPSLQGRFHWHGTAHDIATGVVDKTLAVLWQIAALWMETVLVSTKQLEEELEITKDQFRKAREDPNSPSRQVPDELPLTAISPSKLEILDHGESRSGRLLLSWAATLCGIYGVRVQEFTEGFRDGAALCLILHHYCPKLMHIEELNRIPAAAHRGPVETEAEKKMVQKNLDLLLSRCRLLGTVPEIMLTAEACLAPAFEDSLKGESVGRVMNLLTAYLFRRMMMEKEHPGQRQNVRELFQGRDEDIKALEQHSPHDGMYQSTPIMGRGNVFTQPGRPGISEMNSSPDLQLSDSPGYFAGTRTNSLSTDDASVHTADEDGVSVDTNQHRMQRTNDVLRCHVHSRRDARPTLSQMGLGRDEAAAVILRYYRAYKARKEFLRLRAGVLDVQCAIRGYHSRKDYARMRASAIDSSRHDPSENSGSRCEPALPEENSKAVGSPGVVDAEKPPGLSMSMKSMLISIGRPVQDVLSALGGHMNTIQAFSERMIAHENKMKDDQAASVLQSAGRSYLAQRERSKWENLRSGLRKNWGHCAAEAAKMAIQMANEQRQRVESWQKQIIVSALQHAEGAFNTGMSQMQKQREESNQKRRMVHQERAAKRTEFSVEDENLRKALAEKIQDIEERVLALNSGRKSPQIFSDGEVEFNEDVFKEVDNSACKGGESENMIKQLVMDLSSEREKATQFAIDLGEIRQQERNLEEEISRQRSSWGRRFDQLETDLRHWHGVVIRGAISTAEACFSLHTQDLKTTRLTGQAERRAGLNAIQEALSALDEERRIEKAHESDIEVQLEADCDALTAAAEEHDACIQEMNQEDETLQTLVRSEDLSWRPIEVSGNRAEEAWKSMTKAYEVEAQESKITIEAYQKECARSDIEEKILDGRIEALDAAEKRSAMQNLLCEALELAENRFYGELDIRHTKHMEDTLRRREASLRLDEIAEEDSHEAEELERILHALNASHADTTDLYEDDRQHLQAIENYSNMVDGALPSLFVEVSCPDVSGEILQREAEAIAESYDDTCQVMEHLYLETSSADEDPRMDKWTDCESFDYSRSDMSDETSSGLYKRLVEAEAKFYEEPARCEVGVQAGGQQELSPLCERRTCEIYAEAESEREGDSYDVEDTAHNTQAAMTVTRQGSCGRESRLRRSDQGRALSSGASRNGSATSSDLEAVPAYAGQLDSPRSALKSASADEQLSPTGYSLGHHASVKEHYGPLQSAPDDEKYASSPDWGTQTSNGRAPSGNDLPVGEQDITGSIEPLSTLASLALQDASNMGIRLSEGSMLPCLPVYKSPFAGPISEDYLAENDVQHKENIPWMDDARFGSVAVSKSQASMANSKSGYLEEADQAATRDVQIIPTRDGNGMIPCSAETTPALKADGSFLKGSLEFSRDVAGRYDHSEELDDLGSLSSELRAVNLQPHRESFEAVMGNPASAERLQTLMRRISIATGSRQEEGLSSMPSKKTSTSQIDIIRTILIVIRYCSRSREQSMLRKIGISILRDFCIVQECVRDVMAVEDCIDVVSTCLQYHRDQDSIFDSAMRILWEIVISPNGKMLIMEKKDVVSRLQGVNRLLSAQRRREQRDRNRIRNARAIVDIIRKQKTDGGNSRSMTEALADAHSCTVDVYIPMRDSHRLLQDLVEVIS